MKKEKTLYLLIVFLFLFTTGFTFDDWDLTGEIPVFFEKSDDDGNTWSPGGEGNDISVGLGSNLIEYDPRTRYKSTLREFLMERAGTQSITFKDQKIFSQGNSVFLSDHMNMEIGGQKYGLFAVLNILTGDIIVKVYNKNQELIINRVARNREKGYDWEKRLNLENTKETTQVISVSDSIIVNYYHPETDKTFQICAWYRFEVTGTKDAKYGNITTSANFKGGVYAWNTVYLHGKATYENSRNKKVYITVSMYDADLDGKFTDHDKIILAKEGFLPKWIYLPLGNSVELYKKDRNRYKIEVLEPSPNSFSLRFTKL